MNEIVEKLREKLEDPQGDFPSMIVLDSPVRKAYMMEFQYRKKDKDGNFQKKTSVMSVEIKYNPFTGEKL